MSTTLHLMTQRDQPYGSVRRCCEMCGLMMVNRPYSFWQSHTWTDEPKHYRHWSAGEAILPGELTPCRAVRDPLYVNTKTGDLGEEISVGIEKRASPRIEEEGSDG